MDQLKIIDLRLNEISKRLSFNYINPINVEEEKERFFKSPGYNPRFIYYPVRLANIREELLRIRPDDSVMGRIFSHAKLNYLTLIDLLESRGKCGFTGNSRKLYSSPDNFLVMNAQAIMNMKPREKDYSEVLTSEQVVAKLKLAFVNYGFKWRIVQKRMIADAAVKGGKRLLLVRENSCFTKDFLRRIVVHEIGTHVMRYENGLNQPFLIFSRGLPGYLMTEEGLAVVNEEEYGCLDTNALRTYAGRVLAIEKAMGSSFYETFKALTEHFDRETAWKLTLRAKRGLSDTSKPGALTKDILYLKGYLNVKRFLRKANHLSSLYYGKIGLEHVDSIRDMGNMIPPGFLPMFRYTRFFMDNFSGLFKALVFADV